MGLCLVVTSFTCTAPFIGTLLSVAAKGGNTPKVVAGMGTFGLTMALPFVLLALVPGKVRKMPKAGQWMNTLKVSLGFIELAAALKFFSNADLVFNKGIEHAWVSRSVFLAVWAAIFAITGLYLSGLKLGGSTPRPAISGMRRAIAVLFVALAAYFAYGAMGNPLDSVSDAIAPPAHLPTRHEVIADDIEAGFAKARATDKLLLVNFTGLT